MDIVFTSSIIFAETIHIIQKFINLCSKLMVKNYSQ